jgi:hypothetical protein
VSAFIRSAIGRTLIQVLLASALALAMGLWLGWLGGG